MSTCWVEGEACSCIAEVSKSQQVGEGALQGREHTRGREWEGGEQQHKPTGDVSSSKSKSSRFGRALCEGGSSRFKEPASTRCDKGGSMLEIIYRFDAVFVKNKNQFETCKMLL